MNEATDLFAELSTTLWDQREALDQLSCKLTVEQLIVAAGHPRWLPRVDEEVRSAVQDFRLGEIARASAAQALATACGLPHDATLEDFAKSAPEPWGTLLRDHDTALRELSAEVRLLAAETSELIDACARALHETLESMDAVSSIRRKPSSRAATSPGRTQTPRGKRAGR